MADDKRTNNPQPNPAKGVKAPQLPTKSARDDGGKSRFALSKGGQR